MVDEHDDADAPDEPLDEASGDDIPWAEIDAEMQANKDAMEKEMTPRERIEIRGQRKRAEREARLEARKRGPQRQNPQDVFDLALGNAEIVTDSEGRSFSMPSHAPESAAAGADETVGELRQIRELLEKLVSHQERQESEATTLDKDEEEPATEDEGGERPDAESEVDGFRDTFSEFRDELQETLRAISDIISELTQEVRDHRHGIEEMHNGFERLRL